MWMGLFLTEKCQHTVLSQEFFPGKSLNLGASCNGPHILLPKSEIVPAVPSYCLSANM